MICKNRSWENYVERISKCELEEEENSKIKIAHFAIQDK